MSSTERHSQDGTVSSSTFLRRAATPALRKYFCASTSEATCDQNSGTSTLSSRNTTDPSGLDMVVALAFSGGGTRAAAFFYGVLQGFDDTHVQTSASNFSLLDHIDFRLRRLGRLDPRRLLRLEETRGDDGLQGDASCRSNARSEPADGL